MKKLIISSILIVITVTINFTLGNTDTNTRDTFTIQNLQALQSSAGEMFCDQSHDSTCTINFGDLVGISKGNQVIRP